MRTAAAPPCRGTRGKSKDLGQQPDAALRLRQPPWRMNFMPCEKLVIHWGKAALQLIFSPTLKHARVSIKGSGKSGRRAIHPLDTYIQFLQSYVLHTPPHSLIVQVQSPGCPRIM